MFPVRRFLVFRTGVAVDLTPARVDGCYPMPYTCLRKEEPLDRETIRLTELCSAAG